MAASSSHFLDEQDDDGSPRAKSSGQDSKGVNPNTGTTSQGSLPVDASSELQRERSKEPTDPRFLAMSWKKAKDKFVNQPPKSAPPTAQEPGQPNTNRKTSVAEPEKAARAGNDEAAKPKAIPPQPTALEDITGLSHKQNIDIVAVHDLKQISTAWAYTLEAQYAQGPAIPTKQPRTQDSAPAFPTELKPIRETVRRGEDVIRWTETVNIDSELSGEEESMHPGHATLSPVVMLDGRGKEAAPDVTLSSKGKRKAGDDRRISTQGIGTLDISKELQAPAQDKCQSNPPPSKQASKSPPEMEHDSKANNWLTNQTMLAGDFDQARILAFRYEPFDPPPSTEVSSLKSSYDEYLKDTAEELLLHIKMKRTSDITSKVPLVLIGIGFGCIIIQKLITLVAEQQTGSDCLGVVAAIIFFESPNLKQGEKYEVKKTKDHSITTRLKTITESRRIDTWHLRTEFFALVQQMDLLTICFYTSDTTSKPMTQPGIDFVQLDPISDKSTRFRGPGDPNYIYFIRHLQRCLLLNASSDKNSEELLKLFIKKKYDFNVTDHKRRYPLHRAAECSHQALIRIVNAEPRVIGEQDETGSTPLHIVIKKATQLVSDDDRAAFQLVIEKLVSVLAERGLEDSQQDKDRKSPWEYAQGGNYQWILDLRESPTLLKGALRHGQIKTVRISSRSAEAKASKKMHATLAQFYIATDGSMDYFDRQRPDVYTLIYGPHRVETLFDRNVRSSEGDMKETCRWINLPANNEQWVNDLFAFHLHRIDESTIGRRHLGSVLFDRHLVPSAFRYKQTYVPPNIGSSTKTKQATALFMPIFGFETSDNRQRLRSVLGNPGRLDVDQNLDHTSLLISAYWGNKQFPLHCRRTLDQFTYHMLKDTNERDNDQVMLKWAQREWAERELPSGSTAANQRSRLSKITVNPDDMNYPLLMVDQLWLWVLEDERTVITSLPNTWDSAKTYNHVPHLLQHELMENNDRQLIQGPMDLANSIIRCSIDILQRSGPSKVTLYECFQSSIASIANEQSRQFKGFKSLTKDLHKGGISNKKRTDLTDKLFDLTIEIRLIAEITDIEDELKSIHGVFLQQKEVLRRFFQLLSSKKKKGNSDDWSTHHGTPESSRCNSPISEDPSVFDTLGQKNGSPPALHRGIDKPSVGYNVRLPSGRAPEQESTSWDQAKENLDLVESNIVTIKEIAKRAEKVRIDINGLLSHRQKQANAWEARFAREGAEHTQRQSNIILVFTVVTVFFLPLSFMSSVFAIQIDAYPHNTETGEIDWQLGRVIGLLVGVSLAMILLIGLLAFYINRIMHFFSKHIGSSGVSSGRFGPKTLCGEHSSTSAFDDDSDNEAKEQESMFPPSYGLRNQDTWGVPVGPLRRSEKHPLRSFQIPNIPRSWSSSKSTTMLEDDTLAAKVNVGFGIISPFLPRKRARGDVESAQAGSRCIDE